MFGLDPRRLLGSLPAVLAATLPSNKFCLLYILPCVWKFFSNPPLDHNNEYAINLSALFIKRSDQLQEPARSQASFLCIKITTAYLTGYPCTLDEEHEIDKDA